MPFGLTKKPADYLQEIAKRHKVLRRQAGFSQSSLKRFETSGQISLESLLRLADVLNRLDDFDAILKPMENLNAVEKLFSDKMRSEWNK
jgi:transcriptional regulator with XRE-family HTH domain